MNSFTGRQSQVSQDTRIVIGLYGFGGSAMNYAEIYRRGDATIKVHYFLLTFEL